MGGGGRMSQPTWTGSLGDYERQGLGDVPTPQPSGMTLGQANPQGVPQAQAPGYLADYDAAIAHLRAQMAPLYRQPLPEHGGSSWQDVLANFLSFGGHAIAQHEYRQRYNEGAQA